MPNKVFILILAWSGILAAWTFASPPSGTPGITLGGLFSDSAMNIGIKTSAPATALDVNGTTTIRKSLDMTNNRILNVATPTSSLDAANKAYVDAQIAAMTSSTTRIWSQGRPGTAVINTAGECTRTVSGRTVKVSRSTRPASWAGSAAACPVGWWVCSAAERGAGVCGSGNRNGVRCDVANTRNDDLFAMANTWGWLADTGSVTNQDYGRIQLTDGTLADDYACTLAPVWCCSY